MRHTIERYSDYVRRFLQPGKQGTVHSVYRKTANVLLAGRLFALQERNSPLSPISLITSLSEGEMVLLGIAAGQSVTVTEDEILIGAGSHRFPFAGAEQIPLALNGGNEGLLSPAQLSRLWERVAQALTKADTGGFKYAILCLEKGPGG